MTNAESDVLHARVQRFIRESLESTPTDTFDELACALARFQREHVPSVARLWNATGASVARAADIPAMPTDAFRLRRVAVHAAEHDARVFETSGTTQDARGRHAMRTTKTYAMGALAWAKRCLFAQHDTMPMIVLASDEASLPGSSLSFMLARFAEALGGDVSWHYDGAQVDVAGAIERLRTVTEPTLVAGTSFAFVHFLDAIGERRLALPAGSRVMQTGGFKGRSREVAPARLRAMLAGAFALPESDVVGEYGMTELSSQLYQDGDVYRAPPWLRVSAVDPETLEHTSDDVGLARFVDLANVDSSVAIQTADRITLHPDGAISLHGRAPGATPRGCSLALEHLIADS